MAWWPCFYRLKRDLLGYDELFDYDRYAPVGESDRQYTWEEAREIVSMAYHAFHPRMGTIADLFFDGNWIDAPPTPGKRGGAFSHGAVPSAHPLHPSELCGQVTRRANAGARTWSWYPPVSGQETRGLAGRYALDHRRDRIGFRRDGRVPGNACPRAKHRQSPRHARRQNRRHGRHRIQTGCHEPVRTCHPHGAP